MGPLVALALVAATCTRTEIPSASAPSDLGRVFLQKIKSPSFSGNFTVTGTFTLHSQTLRLSGQGRFRGDDSAETDVLSGPGGQISLQSISARGEDYEKVAEGPWVHEVGTTDPLDRMRSLTGVGIETKSGRRLHHLQPSGAFQLVPSDLGLQDFSVTGLRGAIDFYAEDDGSPAIVETSATWTQLDDGQPVQVNATTRYVLTDIGASVDIQPPRDAWSLFVSRRDGYEIAYPPDWETNREGADIFRAPSGETVIVHVEKAPGKGTLSELISKEVAADGDPGSSEPANLGGREGRLLTYHVTKTGRHLYLLVGLALNAGHAFEVGWVSPAGRESEDRTRFEQFLSTLQFTR